MSKIFRILGCALVSWFAFCSPLLRAQSDNWSTLLAEADRGEKTLDELQSRSPEVITIVTEEDLSSVRDWLRSFDPKQPNDRPNRIANFDSLLSQLISLEYANRPQLDRRSLQATLENQILTSLSLPKESLDPLQMITMRSLYYLMLSDSKRASEILLAASDRPELHNSEYWSSIFYIAPDDARFYNKLKEKVLERTIAGRLAVQVVEHENDRALGDNTVEHFLSCTSGENIVRQWLAPNLDNDMKGYGGAKQAAIALAFLKSAQWSELLEMARNHPDSEVVLEGAWAGARRGQQDSISQLIELAKDVRYSRTAVRYLDELDLDSQIPAEVHDPDFKAQSELSEWLTYPTEKGRPPDQLEIIDSRQMKWPLEDELVNVHLIKFTYKDPTGEKADEVDIGLVGPMTFCHFDMKMAARAKEDIYAIHVFRELEAYELITKIDLAEQPGAFDYLWKAWRGDKLEDAEIIYVAKLEPAVEYPRRLLALATASKNGEAGYVVLDGPRSKWFSKKDRIADTPEESVLMIHLGRQLLGF